MELKVFIERNGLKSKGVYNTIDESITVLKGSQISESIAPHFKDSIYDVLRSELIRDGVIANFKFQRDYKFNRTSPASSVILGSNTNGKKEWIDEHHRDLNSIGMSEKRKDVKQNIDREEILKELFLICEKEAEDKIKKIENKIIERTYSNIDDKDRMLEDIFKLRNEIDDIRKRVHSQDFMFEIVEKLWREYKKN